LDQEIIGALNREKNAITHPLSQIPGYATACSICYTARKSYKKTIHSQWIC